MKDAKFCEKCFIQTSKLKKCRFCGVYSCQECIKEVNPNVSFFNNDENEWGEELTDYCIYKCKNNYKLCDYCGGDFSTIIMCSGCLRPICNDCKKEKCIKGMVNKYTADEKNYMLNFCSVECYEINIQNTDNYSNCETCKCYYYNYKYYRNCVACRIKKRIDLDIKKNSERKKIRDNLKKFINIKKENKKLVEEYFKKRIGNNPISLYFWLNDTEVGNNRFINKIDRLFKVFLERQKK